MIGAIIMLHVNKLSRAMPMYFLTSRFIVIASFAPCVKLDLYGIQNSP
jgi:hypothetical protein